ncbi:MAG: hypothetical protein HS115_16790 [Spirochaetales bacterium]|nr:hypothetical protein [Spirochaetales bacterium]
MQDYQGNFNVIRSMLEREADAYGVLSFLQETIDAMRTDFHRREAPAGFYPAMQAVLDALEKVPLK